MRATSQSVVGVVLPLAAPTTTQTGQCIAHFKLPHARVVCIPPCLQRWEPAGSNGEHSNFG